ncbi:MAG: HD domain-containing protein [Patescibacteria group bacterium]
MDDREILEEVARIKYLYKMKGVFRYGQDRDPWQRAESNAEHLYGMMILVNYFLPLEDQEAKLDRQRIFDLILVHDIDEIENGDIISYKKTEKDREQERLALQVALEKVPSNLAIDIKALSNEYEAQDTPEARFTKAIDKIEPLFEVFDKYGKHIMVANKTTYEQAMQDKEEYLENYPVMMKYLHVLAQEMRSRGYFYDKSNT